MFATSCNLVAISGETEVNMACLWNRCKFTEKLHLKLKVQQKSCQKSQCKRAFEGLIT